MPRQRANAPGPDNGRFVPMPAEKPNLTKRELEGLRAAIGALASLTEGDESNARLYGPDVTAAVRAFYKLTGTRLPH
jgi:hypothetical protein